MQTDSLLFQKAPFQADGGKEYCKKRIKIKKNLIHREEAPDSISKSGSFGVQILENVKLKEVTVLSREPQWCRFLQLWPLQHPSQSPFDFTNDNGDDKHDESSLMTAMTMMMRSTPTPTTFLPC